MIHSIQGKTANDLWLKAAKALASHEQVSLNESRQGPAHELLHCGLSIADPVQRWVFDRKPAMNPAFALAEVVWIMNGSNDAAFLNFWNRKLPEYAGNDDEYYGAYGYRLTRNLDINQLKQAYEALRENPETRQVVLQIWDSRLDLPVDLGQPRSKDIPCNIVSMIKVHNGCLEWSQIIRSNDLFLGVPHNIVQFTSLQEIMAGWLGLKVGSYNQYSDSLHLYERDYPILANIVPSPETANQDRFFEDYDTSNTLLRQLYKYAEKLQEKSVDSRKLLCDFEGPEAYRNVLVVFCAEAERRHHRKRNALTLIEECSNPCYVRLWKAWFQRKQKK